MFRLVQSEDEASMRSAMRSLVESSTPLARVVEVADGPERYDEPTWRALADGLGVTGVLVPEDLGGLGLGWPEVRVVLEELGSSLAVVPFLETAVVAPTVILACGDPEVAGDLLPEIAAGRLLIAVGLCDPGLYADEPHTDLRASLAADGGWRLDGELLFLTFGQVADVVLAFASTGNGEHAWFAVRGDQPSVSMKAMAVVDTTRPQAEVSFRAAPARMLGRPGPCAELFEPVLATALVATACEQVSASRLLLETTVEYTRTRYQFGRPIGSFQALQHRLADLALKVDSAVSAVEFAVWAASEAGDRLPEAASIAGFTCAETFFDAACETIQMHGGIGFTWEHVAHRYYRRALAGRTMLGRPSFHRERLLRSLAI